MRLWMGLIYQLKRGDLGMDQEALAEDKLVLEEMILAWSVSRMRPRWRERWERDIF